MVEELFKDGKRLPRSGLSGDILEPSRVWSGTDVLLAQAESLERLRRADDCKRKLLWAMAVATDSVEAHPTSALAVLNAARIAKAAKQFNFSARLLGAARKLDHDKSIEQAILYQENLLARESDIAGGSQDAMAKRLIVYACQKCGRLVEYISTPCMYCKWHPTALLEASHSGRLSTAWFSLWELMGIGRQIHAGRKATEVVTNLAEVAAELMADPNSAYRKYIEDAVEVAANKKADSYFSYFEASICHNCGERVPRQDTKHCPNCKTALRIPPPLRLLNCLSRVSIHFQHNFDTPQSNEFDLFIRFLVSLQSKLFRMQDTPSDRERSQVLDLMSKLAKFEVVNGLGSILIADPKSVVYQLNLELPEDSKSTANTILTDFTQALQFLADWMFKTKALS